MSMAAAGLAMLTACSAEPAAESQEAASTATPAATAGPPPARLRGTRAAAPAVATGGAVASSSPSASVTNAFSIAMFPRGLAEDVATASGGTSHGAGLVVSSEYEYDAVRVARARVSAWCDRTTSPCLVLEGALTTSVGFAESARRARVAARWFWGLTTAAETTETDPTLGVVEVRKSPGGRVACVHVLGKPGEIDEWYACEIGGLRAFDSGPPGELSVEFGTYCPSGMVLDEDEACSAGAAGVGAPCAYERCRFGLTCGRGFVCGVDPMLTCSAP
jgi:hypothetical protein